jgi:pimeloyl-ACP methyl ester carboxylesterase
VVAVDLPCDDESAGWSRYADAVVDAIGDRSDLVVWPTRSEASPRRSRVPATESLATGRHQSGTPMLEPWPLEAWPDVPTRYLLRRDDRVFRAEFIRRLVRERLGIAPDEIDGGHYPLLSRPTELAERLEGYRAGLSERR